MIHYNHENKTFFLATKNSSYVMKVLESGLLTHLYYGSRISEDNLDFYNFYGFQNYAPLLKQGESHYSKDGIPFEYPVFGDGDFRNPALVTKTADGRKVNNLVYSEHKIHMGKIAPKGLPNFDCNTDGVETLEIVMIDSVSGFELSLFYSVFEDEDAITRHSVIKNKTSCPIDLESICSLSVDFEKENFDMITLHGAWARERHINRQQLIEGSFSVESRRGASGHQHCPFAALADKNTTEQHGKVYGFSLVYSGNFKATAETDQFGSARFQIGINPFNFTYRLESREYFTTPEAVMVYSENGLNGMSRCFHNMCKKHLGKSADTHLKHPIVINSWEAMYFDMNEEKINSFISNCKGLGIDTFVLDDGWFGHRNSDDSSLGDWFVDDNKFPCGLKSVIETCRKNGMNFGIWFEPEMISYDSELYRNHPDWCIHLEGKQPTEARNQLVLDMSRPEVVDSIFKQISKFLNEYDISYVKWDMNRNITDNGSHFLPENRQGEHSHRYILGVYDLMRRLTENHPDVFFEGCAGGGGRMDFGILYYMPQFWTSDDTDAIERLKIQYGSSLVFPCSVMTAHVSACPNHQTGRTVPFKTRGDVAQICNFGYELDINLLSKEEKEQIREQTALHKEIEPLLFDGDFYRLISPFETDNCCWQLVSADKSTSFAMFAVQKATPHSSGQYLKFTGLEPDSIYNVEPLGLRLHGNTLMNAGIPIAGKYTDFIKDFSTMIFLLKKI